MMFGLKDDHFDGLRRIFHSHATVTKAVVFGSRARGDNRIGSDLDICVFGDGISLSDMAAMDAEIDDLLIPVFTDLLDFETVGLEALRKNIIADGKVIYQR